jgi:methionyl-tRNA synthetase
MSQQNSKKPYYITTTLPYVNSNPHVGHAMEFIRADTLARIKRLEGYEVFFNTGTDEHGQKIFEAAEKNGVDVQTYVDGYAENFKGLITVLGISTDTHFIRTTDEKHIASAQEFWRRCRDAGFIYKKNYVSKYCIGCELEKTDSELVDGKCAVHPHMDLELRDEENYFFKYSAFQDKLLALYESQPDLVIPAFRFNEIKSFVKSGLQDFSISRLKSKMSWGIPVPDDDEHVMYVWFDALVNYISTLDWPKGSDMTVSGDNAVAATFDSAFARFWQSPQTITVQYCGKDNLRQQSAMWQAMLMSVGIKPTSHIIINGFLTGDGGIKMSKSIGNVVSPYDIVAQYGTDALRFFCLSEVSSFEDSPFTMERFKESYNAKLANGIGNLTSRIMKMLTSYEVDYKLKENPEKLQEIFKLAEGFDLNKAITHVFDQVATLNEKIQSTEPFKKIKIDRDGAISDLCDIAQDLYDISCMLVPFLPETAQRISRCMQEKKVPEEALFLRRE